MSNLIVNESTGNNFSAMKSQKSESFTQFDNLLYKTLLKLSKREGEVLMKVTEGKTNQQIADELYLSVRTVENTRARICKKLNLKGRGALKKWIANIIIN